jgi:hypothetical protein
MSGFIGSASGGTGGFASQLRRDDTRHVMGAYNPAYQHNNHVVPVDGQNGFSFKTPWWPRSAFDATGGEMIGDMMGSLNPWEPPSLNSGAVSKLAFVGVSRDEYGSILVACLMKLFKTADGNFPDTKDRILDTFTSDATTGAFLLLTPYAEAHYITLYKSGSPDRQGISVNTLVGA